MKTDKRYNVSVERTCSRCESRPAAANHTWCRECKNQHAKAISSAHDALVRGSAFLQGAEAMAKTLETEFERFPTMQVTMLDAARIIRGAPRPKPHPNGS